MDNWRKREMPFLRPFCKPLYCDVGILIKDYALTRLISTCCPPPPPLPLPRGSLPCTGYIGLCRAPKGYGFLAVLVRNRVGKIAGVRVLGSGPHPIFLGVAPLPTSPGGCPPIFSIASKSQNPISEHNISPQ